MGEVRQEAAPLLRAALAAAHGERGEGLNQGNAKRRRMISCCPPRGTGLLSSFITELLAVRERLHKQLHWEQLVPPFLSHEPDFCCLLQPDGLMLQTHKIPCKP